MVKKSVYARKTLRLPLGKLMWLGIKRTFRWMVKVKTYNLAIENVLKIYNSLLQLHGHRPVSLHIFSLAFTLPPEAICVFLCLLRYFLSPFSKM